MFGKFARQRTSKGKQATVTSAITDQEVVEERQQQAEEYRVEEHHDGIESLRDCANETESIEEQDHPFVVSF